MGHKAEAAWKCVPIYKALSLSCLLTSCSEGTGQGDPQYTDETQTGAENEALGLVYAFTLDKRKLSLQNPRGGQECGKEVALIEYLVILPK